LATASVAMMPLAPGRLSTTSGWPSAGPSLSASTRATRSDAPSDVTTYSFAALPALVVGTDRVATVHERLLKHFGAGLPLVQHPLPMPMPPMEQGLQWHKYRSKDPGLSWLRALMHQAVQRMDA